MSGQTETTIPDKPVNGAAVAAPAQGNTVEAPPAGDPTVAALASYAARAEKAERELAARAAAEREAGEKYKADLAASGKYAELAEARAKEIEEYKAQLAALQADAGYGKAWRESETKRIERVTESMDSEWRDLIDSVPDLAAKAKIAARYEQTQAQVASAAASSPLSSPSRKPPPSAAPAPATASVDLVAMIEGKQITVAEARRRYPAEYLAQIESQVSAKAKPKTGWFGL
jgi:hypothetical protein